MNEEIKRVAAETIVVEIFIGGDVDQVKQYLAFKAANQGACWSVEPTEFVYSGGREQGCVVRNINYPRFPSTVDKLMEDAILLGEELIYDLGQGSCSVVGPKETVWLTRRKGD